MKRFGLLVTAALVVLVTVVAMSAMLNASAAEENVIYISDNGTGDGSSATKPLGPETRVENTNDPSFITDSDPSNDYNYYSNLRLFQNSVLYQAAEKLSLTGGKIVIVGDVVIDYSNTYAAARTTQRDFDMPTHGNNHITITAENGGRLVMTEGAYLNLGGKTTFENMSIVTKTGRNSGNMCDYNLAICCSLYEVVFGDGLNCINETYGSSASAQYYLSIAGTKRYGDCTGDTNITIKSGKWYNVYGSMFGNAGDIHRGDTNVTVTGGTIKGYLIGGARDNAIYHFGDINIDISGGTFNGCIYATNATGAGYKSAKANVKISGGSFASSNLFKKNTGTLVENGLLPNVTIDLSDYPSGIYKNITADTIIYPKAMISSVSLKTEPSNGLCYLNEGYVATGMKVTVNYSNGKPVVVAYDFDNSDFVLNCNSAKEGSAVVTGTYGGKNISGLNKPVNVVATPVPKVLGAQISTEKVNGGLRFVAEMARSAEKYVSVKDYGFYIFDGSLVDESDLSNLDSIYGGEKTTSYGKKFRAEYDELGIYNNDKKTTFSAIFDNVRINDYEKEYVAVAYVEFEYNGETYTRYSAPVKKSVLGVAKAAMQEPYEDTSWIKSNIIDKYTTYTNDIKDKYLSNYDSNFSETLRDIVVGEMNANANFAWTPSANLDLTEAVTANGVKYSGSVKYLAGSTYYGMPYVNNSKADFDEFRSFVKTYKDGTNVYLGPIEGVVDFYTSGSAPYKDVQSKLYKIDERYHEITSFVPATDYTGVIVNVWNKVGTNNVCLTDIPSFIPASGRGTIAVGDYDYSLSSSNTGVITSNSGQSTMYSSYEKCKRGDVVIGFTSSTRSIYMVMEDAVSGNESLTLMTFNPTMVNVKNSLGSVIGQSHFRTETKTFSYLYNSGFIPVTLPELAGGTYSETAAYVKGFDGKEIMESGLFGGTLVSNKQIISVNVKLSRFEGDGIIFDKTVYCNSTKNQNVNSFDLSAFDMSKYLVNLVDGKTYTLTVSADIANEGVKEIVSYEYTEPTPVIGDLYESYYNSFNVDHSNMTQSVIDHMKAQMDIYWTPASTFKYANLTGSTGFVPKTEFTAGKVYRGILYANTRATIDDFQASLGTATWNSALNKNVYTLSGVSGTTDWNYVMGNHCSSSMYHAYQQVIRLHASSRGNADMRLLGLDDLYYGVASYTNSVVLLYGNEAIYESYAMAKQGDFVYKNSTGGHTRIVQEVNVVRDSVTGRIDPEKSTILMIEQTDTLESSVYGKAANGTSSWTPELGYDSTWWEHTYTFKLLATGNSAAIIMRPTEFATNETETPYVGLTRKAVKSNLESSGSNKMGVVESNYPIIGVYATVTLEDGTVYRAESRAMMSTNSFNVTDLFTSKEETYTGNPGKYLYRNLFAGKKYTYKLEVELAVGRVVLDELTVS